ncbi:hypothetical protein [Thermomonospora amylolytica]|uniref:hypothetical protein n=1 Tax=Thermomonospora amylolytica TaxID=1411117 RepID=UPI001F489673|nr:hypothetical protein [Thermomonospora amylolytica]
MERRAFLVSSGLAGAALAVPGVAGAAEPDDAGLVRQALSRLAVDTFSGLAVFVMPGPDLYSRVQGTPRPEPGGIEARAPQFLVEHLNRYLPFPDRLAVPIMRALMQGAGGLALPSPRDDAPGGVLGRVDAGLRRLLENDATVPLAPVVALLLNLEAVRVAPLAVAGPFLSPFARLRYARKARVFELLEGPDPTLVSLFDRHLPEPLKGSVSGLLKFLAGALLELTALGAYSEWAVFDPDTRRLRGRPVGWQVSGYTPSIDGWDEHKGYYQGRKQVTG